MDHRLAQLQKKALSDGSLRKELLKSRKAHDPLSALAAIAQSNGFDLTAEELATLGEESTAAMLRSQNGGGEYEPDGDWSDEYEIFFLTLENAE